MNIRKSWILILKEGTEMTEADTEELMVRAEYTPLESEGKTIEPFLTALDFSKERIIFPLYQADTLDHIS